MPRTSSFNNAISILLVLASFWLIPAAHGIGLPDTIAKVKPSVVAVGSFAPLRQPRSVFKGTGWAVGDGRYVVTNHHVVNFRLDQKTQETHAIFVPEKSRRQPKAYKASIVACDKRHDLCVLKIKGIRLPPLKLGHAADVREGETYAMTGFPIGMVLGLYPVTHEGIVAAVTPIAIPAIRSKQLSKQMMSHLSAPFSVLQMDAIAYPGNSGSPLYEVDTGKVVGVVNSVFVKGSKETVLERPSGISYAIPVTHVYNLLIKAKVKI